MIGPLKTVFLDLDDVLVDFAGGVRKTLGGPPLFPWRWPYNEWNWFRFAGWTREQVNSACTREFWRDLKWTADGRDILHEVITRLAAPGQIYLLTAPMPNLDSASGKMDWVHKNLPSYESRTIITGAPKALLAGPNRVLIDDRNENVDGFIEAGGMGFLIPRPWNRLWQAAEQGEVKDVFTPCLKCYP